MPEVHGSTPRPERPPAMDPTLFDDEESKHPSLPDIDDRGPTEMGEIPESLQAKSEREGKIERVGFSERARALYASLSEQGKKLVQEVYAEVPTADVLKNMSDRFRVWNSERLAEAAQRELVNLKNRMNAGEQKLRGFEAATKRELTELQQTEEKIRAQGYTLSEAARNKVDENLENYRLRAEAVSKDSLAAFDRSAKVTEKMKELALKSGAARQRIESRLEQQQGVRVEAVKKLQSVDANYGIDEQSMQKQIDVLDEQHQELQAAKRGSKSKDFIRLVNDLMISSSKKRAELEYFKEKMSAERKLLQKRIVEVADTKDLIDLSANDDDVDIEDDEPTQVTPVSELPTPPTEDENTNPDIVLTADASDQPKSAWFQDAEAPVQSEQTEAEAEQKMPAADIIQKWNESAPIKNLSFKTKDLSKIAAFKEKGILRLSEKDAADFLEKVATGVRGKKLNLSEKKKVTQFVKEMYQG